MLARVAGDHGDQWHELLADTVTSAQPWQLYLEARVGRSYLGDIAVDTVQLLPAAECAEARAHYVAPQPARREGDPAQLSPGSCAARCGAEVEPLAVARGWREGACQCGQQCATPPARTEGPACCRDYGAVCAAAEVTAPVVSHKLYEYYLLFLISV